MTMDAPPRARLSASAWPMPRELPVMSATLPWYALGPFPVLAAALLVTSGLVGQRRRDEDAVSAGQAQMPDLHRRSAAERVHPVHDTLRLAGGARGEQQLGPPGGRRHPRRQRCAAGPLAAHRGGV